MKAIQYTRHGSADVLEYRTVPDPEPRPGWVVLAVKAAAVNHIDIHSRRGVSKGNGPLPHIPGIDGAGVVVSRGAGVTNVCEGDRAALYCCVGCGACEHCLDAEPMLCSEFYLLGVKTNGSYAELMSVPAANLIAVPTQVSFATAAAAPVIYTSAWSMVQKARLRPGATVLVSSAGAGVSTALIQIAKLYGATVFASVGSAAKVERARELGADAVIDLSAHEVDKEVRALTSKRGVDVVFDHVGGDRWPQLLRSLRNGGTLVTCGATDGKNPVESLEHIFYRQLRVIGSSFGRPSEFHAVMKLVFDGRLRPVVDSTVPLEQAASAHRRIEDRTTFGKVVLVP